jgi:hypothetical protein
MLRKIPAGGKSGKAIQRKRAGDRLFIFRLRLRDQSPYCNQIEENSKEE